MNPEEFSRQLMKRLSEPFAFGVLGFRPQSVKGDSCIALPYLDARDVMDRLDDVLGSENWQDSYDVLENGVVCRLAVRINGEWVTKTDVGDYSDQPEAGNRLKAGFSDALKRTAVKFGIGRYITQLDVMWAKVDEKKQIIKTSLKWPAWALPGGSGRPDSYGQQTPNSPAPRSQPAPQQQQQPRPQQQAAPTPQQQHPPQAPANPPVAPSVASDEAFKALLGGVAAIKSAVDLANWRALVAAQAKTLTAEQVKVLMGMRDQQIKIHGDGTQAPPPSPPVHDARTVPFGPQG